LAKFEEMKKYAVYLEDTIKRKNLKIAEIHGAENFTEEEYKAELAKVVEDSKEVCNAT